MPKLRWGLVSTSIFQGLKAPSFFYSKLSIFEIARELRARETQISGLRSQTQI